jgi:hypothetical protein
MGDVRIPALATLLAAATAVAGSIFVVWLSGRHQRQLQTREFADRASSRNAQWEREAARAATASEVDACVRFDAAVAIAVARLHRMMDFVGRPGVRRRLLGHKWAQHWNRDVTQAVIELAVPLSAVRLTARAAVRHEVTAVATAFEEAAAAMATLPTYLPELLLRGPVVSAWRARVEEAIQEVQGARVGLSAVLAMAELGGELDSGTTPNVEADRL